MAADKKFFLGQGGEQTGPFTEAEIKEKISAGAAKPDTLVWYEGLGEWQRVDTIAYFQSAFRKDKGAGQGVIINGKPQESRLQPVFSAEEAIFFRSRLPRPAVMVAGVILLVVGAGAFWYLDNVEDSTGIVGSLIAKKVDLTTRRGRLQKADSDLLLNSSKIPDDFFLLAKEDPTDEFGKRAVLQLEELYKKRKMPRELAKLYVAIGRPWDAVAPFMEEKAFSEAFSAANEAYQKATDPVVRKAMLMKSIEFLTGPLKDAASAIAKIQELEKTYPNDPHPFGYYLLPVEKKMSDLFNRTSYFFVESLVTHMKAEFPSVKLDARPVVSIAKAGNRYRVVGSYKGGITLNYDKLSNIRFEYWMSGSNDWNLVATNVTGERQTWAKNNRARHEASLLEGAAMLLYLENVMRNQFPTVGLHERPTQNALASAARETSSKP